MDQQIFSQNYGKNLSTLLKAGFEISQANHLAGKIKQKMDAEARARFRAEIEQELERYGVI